MSDETSASTWQHRTGQTAKSTNTVLVCGTVVGTDHGMVKLQVGQKVYYFWPCELVLLKGKAAR